MRRRSKNRTGGNFYRARTRKQKRFERSVKKIAREVVLADPEIKFLDTGISESTAYTGNSQFHCLTLIPEGDGDNARSGGTVKLRSLEIKSIIKDIGAANAVGDVYCRVLLLQVRETNGADPTATEVLNTDDVLALRNWDYRKDIVVLKDKRIILRKHDTVGHRSTAHWHYYKKFPFPMKATYTTANANVAATNNNHLFLMVMSDAADTDDPSFFFQCRLTYTDA